MYANTHTLSLFTLPRIQLTLNLILSQPFEEVRGPDDSLLSKMYLSQYVGSKLVFSKDTHTKYPKFSGVEQSVPGPHYKPCRSWWQIYKAEGGDKLRWGEGVKKKDVQNGDKLSYKSGKTRIWD